MIYLPRHEDEHVTRWRHVATVSPPRQVTTEARSGNGTILEVAERAAEHNDLELGLTIAENRNEFY